MIRPGGFYSYYCFFSFFSIVPYLLFLFYFSSTFFILNSFSLFRKVFSLFRKGSGLMQIRHGRITICGLRILYPVENGFRNCPGCQSSHCINSCGNLPCAFRITAGIYDFKMMAAAPGDREVSPPQEHPESWRLRFFSEKRPYPPFRTVCRRLCARRRSSVRSSSYRYPRRH